MLTIRIRSGRFPFQRAGIAIKQPRAWQEESIPLTLDGAAQLLRLIQEPVLQVEAKFNDAWRALNTGDIKELFADAKALADSVAATGKAWMDAADAIFTDDHEAAMRELGEAMIKAVREGRSPLPSLQHLKDGIDHFNNLVARGADLDDDDEDALVVGAANTVLGTIEPTLERATEDTTSSTDAGAGSAGTGQGDEEVVPPAAKAGDTSSTGEAEGSAGGADGNPLPPPIPPATVELAKIAPPAVKAKAAPKPKAEKP